MENKTIKPENPARAFLRRYRMLTIRQDALTRAIREAHDRAMSCTVRLKPIHVTGGGGAYDRIAEDVATMTDAEGKLRETLAQVNAALSDILAAIDAVQDEAQKTVLTLRYINGFEWPDIQAEMGYERTQAYVIHGWALQQVKRWMINRGML